MNHLALVLQNQLDAPPALLADWSRERDVQLAVVRADLSEQLPSPHAYDFAVVLGSNASAAERSLPWVAAEIDWLRHADRLALPVLGICFGAQALAVALGGSVHRQALLEIGWTSVESDAPDLVGAGPWFAWHEDAIQLPARATEIARNAFGTQAFTAGAHLGLQFHPEVTPAVAGAWAGEEHGARQLQRVGLDRLRLQRDSASNLSAARAAAFRCFDAFLAGAGATVDDHSARASASPRKTPRSHWAVDALPRGGRKAPK